MQNPFDMTTYCVGSETYRRNCPMEGVTTTTLAAGATFSAMADESAADEEEKTLSPTSSVRSSTSADVRPAPFAPFDSEPRASTDRKPTEALTAEIAREIGELPSSGENAGPSFVERKTVEVVSAEDGWVYTEKATQKKALGGTVRYDEAKQCFYDSLLVPTNLVGMIRGADSFKQKQIQAKHHCTIKFPERKRVAGTETEIKFFSTESALHVQSCGEALKKAEVVARKSAQATHFISVPIFDSNLREQYNAFLDKVCSDERLPEHLRNKEIYVKENKLHLTINALRLFTDKEVQEVREFLDKQFQSEKIREILKRGTDGQFRIEFAELQPMEGQLPEECRVIFVEPESEDLQDLFNTLDDALAEAGMGPPRRGPNVLLHMTVLNLKKIETAGRKGKHRDRSADKRLLVDATELFEHYKDFRFDSAVVDQIHLCEMRGNSDPNAENGYISVHHIEFKGALSREGKSN